MCCTTRWRRFRAPSRRRSTSKATGRLAKGSPPRTTGCSWRFLPNPNSPTGTVIPPAKVAKLAAALPCPLIVDEAYADFADDELPRPRRRERAGHGDADAQQVVQPRRAAVWLRRRPAAGHRAAEQSERLVQLRFALDRRGDGGDRRSGPFCADARRHYRHSRANDGSVPRARVRVHRLAGQFRLVPPCEESSRASSTNN